MRISSIVKTLFAVALTISLGVAQKDSTKSAATKAPATKSAPVAAKTKAKTHTFSGTVTAIDSIAKTLSGTNKNGAQTFTVAADAKIQNGKTTVALSSIAANTKVLVTFSEEAGVKTASIIKIQDEGKKSVKATSKTAKTK